MMGTIDKIVAQDPATMAQTHPLTGPMKGWYATKASRGHRVVHRPHEDGGTYIGYVGLHEYGKAIQRLTSKDDQVTLYHGTPVGNVASIEAEGLRAADDGVYLIDTPERARRYGGHQGGDDVAVYEATVPRSWVSGQRLKGAYTVSRPIPPERLRRHSTKTGPGEGLPPGYTLKTAAETPRLWPQHPLFRPGDRVVETTPNGNQYPATVHHQEEPTDPDSPGMVWIGSDRDQRRGPVGVNPRRLEPHPDAPAEQHEYYQRQRARNEAGEPYVPQAERDIDLTDRVTVHHLTDRHDFTPDVAVRPQNNTTIGGSLSPRLFVGNPRTWADGEHHYRRPYVAEMTVPRGAVRYSGGYLGEGEIPARHFNKVEVTRVIPYSEHQREQEEPGYRSPTDTRTWTNKQHRDLLRSHRERLHTEHGWGWNEFDKNHNHVGLGEQDWDEDRVDPNSGYPGTYVRRDKKGRPMTQVRSSLAPSSAAVRQVSDTIGDGDGITDSIMIALVPPAEIVEDLALPQGEAAEQLHVTLAFLGKTGDYSEALVGDLAEVVAAWAEGQDKFTATVQGVGTFLSSTQDGQHVLWASVEAAGIQALRADLVTYLRRHGYTPSDDFSFTPHLTLAYSPDRFTVLPAIERSTFTVHEVWVCIGGTWQSVPFRG